MHAVNARNILTNLLTFTLHLLTLTKAFPSPIPQSGFPPAPDPSSLFYLRIHVPSPPPSPSSYNTTKDSTCPVPGSTFNNTYLSSYHTGAGLNDVILTPDVSIAASGFLNGTALQFALGGGGPGPGETIPWVMELEEGQAYTSFGPATINAGLPDPSNGPYFYFNSSTTPPGGLAVNFAGTTADPLANATTSENRFAGWLVCEWWHYALPQLFWFSGFEAVGGSQRVPAGCARVVVLREGIED